MPREIPVTAIMDVDGDEVGPADDDILRCPDCQTLYRAGGRHRCENGEWV